MGPAFLGMGRGERDPVRGYARVVVECIEKTEDTTDFDKAEISEMCNTYPVNSHEIFLSLLMRKPTICICENKDADQLRGNREADQRLCFRYTDSKLPLLSTRESVISICKDPLF